MSASRAVSLGSPITTLTTFTPARAPDPTRTFPAELVWPVLIPVTIR